MICPTCGATGAYIGFSRVECENPACMHYIKKTQDDTTTVTLHLFKAHPFVECDFLGYAPKPIYVSDLTHPYFWINFDTQAQMVEGYYVETTSGEKLVWESIKEMLEPGGTVEVVLVKP